jgi:serine/threonine protein kinase
VEPGNLIAGRYRLEQRLAAGGMGEVWRGTDTRLNRVVAVKLLHSGLSGNDRFRARFHQEAQAVAQLQSPGIVALYDYGEEHAPEGLVSYLIMELVRGQALDNVLRQRRRLSPNETLKIMASAAEALDVAHQAHIIHRDIKPGNLLVDPDGSVKIVDFGIAAAKGGAGLTETGTVMGTLAYASPEQLQGSQLTGATDVYSLGIVGYEALAGRPPFAGNEPTAAIAGHLTGTPAPLPPDIPPPVANIIMRCLAKDPRQRFSSAAELAQVCRAGGMGGGTTAILSPGVPSPNPYQSPDSTRVMTPGAGGAMGAAMGAGVVQAHTSPIQQQQFDDYGPAAGTGQYRTGGAPERPLPPPRDMEQAKRNPTGPILVSIAGVAVILIALFMWSPWDDDEDDPSGASDDTSTETSEVVEENPETTAEEENTDDGGDEDNGGDEEEENTDEETTEQEVELITMEDYEGWAVADAVADLEEQGFENIYPYVPTQLVGVYDECEVVEQDPGPDAEVDWSVEISLGYAPPADGNDCGVE